MIFPLHLSFYHLCSYHVCDLNLLLDFKYLVIFIKLSFDTLSNFIEKRMAEQTLLFHAFLIYE